MLITPKIKRKIGSFLLMTTLIYIGFGAMLNIYQYNFIYFPTDEIIDDNFNYIALRSENETLKIWVTNPDQKEAIIFFGGNAANAFNAIPQFQTLFSNRTVYLINYRGYGGSTGYPTEKGLTTDSLNIYDFIQGHHTKISAIGRSLGTGIATYLAANRPLDKLILVTPYDSIEAVAQGRYFMYPISYLLRDKYNSVARTDSITEPTLLLIADQDSVVPTHHAHALAKTFKPEQITVITLPDTNHSTISHHPDYSSIINDFL